MSTHARKGGKSTAHDSDAQNRCQDERCNYGDPFHSAEAAQSDAHEHADITGHTVDVDAEQFSRTLTVVGQLEVQR